MKYASFDTARTNRVNYSKTVIYGLHIEKLKKKEGKMRGNEILDVEIQAT